MKLLLKLVVAALIANAAWRVGTAYLSYYRFKDSVQQLAQFGAGTTRAQLRERVLTLASQNDLPLDPENVTVQRPEPTRTVIDGDYTQPVDVVPGYRYPWPFKVHVEVSTLQAGKPDQGESR